MICAFFVSFVELMQLPPSVFLIGSMKAGSTSLSKALVDHPNFCNDPIKEKHFFDHNSNYVGGVQWFMKRFPTECTTTSVDYLTLDATPNYIRFNHVPGLMKEFYGPDELAKKKFILILRDPVSRLVMIIVHKYTPIYIHIHASGIHALIDAYSIHKRK